MKSMFEKLQEKCQILRSMHLQVFVVMLVIGVAPVYIFSHVLLNTYESEAIVKRVEELQNKSGMIADRLLSSQYFHSAREMELVEVESEISRMAEGYQGRIVVVNRDLRIVKDTYELEEGKTIISEQVLQCYRGNPNKYIDRDNEYMELVNPISNAETGETEGILIMSFPITNIFDLYEILYQKAVLVILVIFIFIGILAYIYSAMVTRPYSKVASAIDHVTEGYLDEEVSIRGFQEVQKISDSFNLLLTRLQTLEESRQEFVSNVSHELKTPITSMKVLSDSLLSQENVPAELYREFMVDIAEEIDRETQIINDLLSLVKMDRKSGEMNIAPTDINALVEQVLKRIRPIAETRNIELVFESFRPVEAEVDAVKLSLAVNNLIENAVKYNLEDGWVHVSLNADHKFFYLKVSDSGVGIPEDVQDKIFERFYRVDKARSRETGGTGLGLSITRGVILMHRGSIKVYSKTGEGSTFTMRIPLSYIA